MHRVIGKTHKDNYIVSYFVGDGETHKFPHAGTQNCTISASELRGSTLR